MTFQKGNDLWRKGLEVRKQQRTYLETFLVTLGREGLERYADKLITLSQKEELTKPEKEFMDRFEGWREYIVPKLARTEITGKDGADLIPKEVQRDRILRFLTKKK